MNYEPPAWVKDAQEKYKRTSEEVLDKISSAFKKLKVNVNKTQLCWRSMGASFSVPTI